jgi:Nif-specific regulatory protein
MRKLPDDVARNDLHTTAAARVTRGVDLNELLVELVDRVVRKVGADRGTLYLVDGANQTLTSIVAHLPELEHIRLEVGQGIAGTVAATGEVVAVDDPAADPRHEKSFDDRTGYRTTSILALPVHDAAGETIGVMQLLNARSGSFGEEDANHALELCAQVGQVLQATSLYADLRREGPLEAPRPGLAYRFNQIIGESAAMRDVYELVEKAARTDATVLITGESGTGKELIARAVHVNGRRRDQAFVKVDCTTLPAQLMENELFGHERGAFTGADRTVPGKVEAADGGTLFIDEIGELPLPLQGKLLRLLQDREFERVGGTKTIHSDIRIVCATHRNLLEMVERGEFREDLYYRIKVVPIELPPLRARGKQDLLRLVEHFVEKFGRRHQVEIECVTEAALERLATHPFPGNVRELENCIESAVVLCDDARIDADDLPLTPRNSAHGNIGDPQLTLAELEKLHVHAVLDACEGNQSEAARRLGIGRNTLARKLSAD